MERRRTIGAGVLEFGQVGTLGRAGSGSGNESRSPVCSTKTAHPHPPGHSLLLAVVLAAGVAFAGAVSAEEPPMVLSDRHVGMTGEDIAAEEQAVKAERIELALAAEPDDTSEWVDASPGTAAAAEAHAEACPVAVPGDAASSMGFERCVEAAIRAGNAFGESSRVCRAVFPEASAAE